MIKYIIAWFKNFTLYRAKVSMFTFLVAAVTIDINIKIDLINKTFEYLNGELALWPLLALLFTMLILIVLDIWLYRIKSKERIANNFLKTIRETNIDRTLKEEIVEFLRKDY